MSSAPLHVAAGQEAREALSPGHATTAQRTQRRWSISPDDPRALTRRSLEVAHGSGGTNLLACICLFVQAVMGGGLLTYPSAYKSGGVVNMIVLQALMLAFIAPGLWILAICAEFTGAGTYQALVKRLLGRRAEVICEILVVVLIFGAAITYLDIFIDQVQPWFVAAYSHCTGTSSLICGSLGLLSNRFCFTLIAAVFFSLLCLGRNMASLSIPSLFGFGALLYVCCIIVCNFVVGAAEGQYDFQHAEPPPAWVRSDWQSWVSTLPVICFSYQGHISAVPLYAELRKRSMHRWAWVISLGLFACVFLYNATGILGYLQFLNATNSDILKSFDAAGYTPNIPVVFVNLARGATAMAVSVTSAVFTFCARSAIVNEVSALQGIEAAQLPYTLFLFITYIWVTLVAAAAICFPDIGVVVSIVGNVCALFMFQFPGLCLIALAHENGRSDTCPEDRPPLWHISDLPGRERWQVIIGVVFITLGNLVFVFGLYHACNQLF